MRLLIAGVPRSGKTTLSKTIVRTLPCSLIVMGPRSTDDMIALGWSAASERVAQWLDAAGPWIIEGVAIPRALRKWLATHHYGTPADEIRWLGTPRVPLTPGQLTMAKACETVWNEVRPELERRGVVVRFG
jgi:adenylate kinase family enzyme